MGHFAAGIFVSAPGGNNRILNNEVVGAGTYPIISGQGGFGIFVGEPGAPSNNNLIQENNASGNPGAGIFISGPSGPTPGSKGNKVLNNQALGNINAGDIFDANAPGANTYKDNLCEVSNINICELPNIARHRNPSSEEE